MTKSTYKVNHSFGAYGSRGLTHKHLGKEQGAIGQMWCCSSSWELPSDKKGKERTIGMVWAFETSQLSPWPHLIIPLKHFHELQANCSNIWACTGSYHLNTTQLRSKCGEVPKDGLHRRMVMAHTLNPSIREAERGGSLRDAGQPGLQDLVPGQPGLLDRETLSQKPRKKLSKIVF